MYRIPGSYSRLHKFKRTYVTCSHPIYISSSLDPLFNLSFEDWLFRHAPKELPILMLYRCSPSVVIGRNQNPWKEVNFPGLNAVNFVRRRSGGGTVYHDLGNTNFSIHTSRVTFDRSKTSQLILRAVRALGFTPEEATVNERNDLCSAYKIASNRAYHHGTMLISTKLDDLGDILRVSDKDSMHTKGVASVRSPVNNLRQYSPRCTITHAGFCEAVVAQFLDEYEHPKDIKPIVIDETTPGILTMDNGYIQKGIDELSSWNWLYGQTPEFTYSVSKAFAWGIITIDIKSKHGMILECVPRLQVAEERHTRTQHHPSSSNGSVLPHGSCSISDDLGAVVQRVCAGMKGRKYGDVQVLEGFMTGGNTGSWDGQEQQQQQQQLPTQDQISQWLIDVTC